MSSQMCVSVDYCEMSLMREFVAFKSICLRETVILYMYCPLTTILALTCLHKKIFVALKD